MPQRWPSSSGTKLLADGNGLPPAHAVTEAFVALLPRCWISQVSTTPPTPMAATCATLSEAKYVDTFVTSTPDTMELGKRVVKATCARMGAQPKTAGV